MTDDRQGTGHIRMPVPPGGDAGRHPGSPRIGTPDAEPESSTGDENSGRPHSGRRHQAEDDEQLPGEWQRHQAVNPPPDH